MKSTLLAIVTVFLLTAFSSSTHLNDSGSQAVAGLNHQAGYFWNNFLPDPKVGYFWNNLLPELKTGYFWNN